MSNRRFRRREPPPRPATLDRYALRGSIHRAISLGAAAHLTHRRCLQIDEMFAEGSSDWLTSDNHVTETSGAAEKQ